MRFRGRSGWFTFFRSEHRGAALLFAVALVLALIPRMLYHYQQPQKYQFSYDSAAVSKILSDQEAFRDSLYGNHKKAGKYFYYGSKNQLIAMGFSPEAAERIESARKKGKRFASISDLSAETGLDSVSLLRIVKPGTFKKPEKTKEIDIAVELNSADTNVLKKLPGIGGKTAKRILGYREKLGGFYNSEQLMEIWYVDTIVLRKLFSQFEINTDLIHKIKLNEMPEQQMEMHPYISKSQARILAAYTRQNGNITLEIFKRMAGFKPSERSRLLPYLDFN